MVHESQMSCKMPTVRLAIMLLLTFGRTSSLGFHDACAICSCTGGAVNCSYRNLHEVPNGLSPSAVSLNLSHNLLHYLPDSIFHNLTNLTILDMSFNDLTNLTQNVFLGLRSLQWLSVAWNNMSLRDETYPYEVFSPFSKTLLYLYLNGNSPFNQSQPLNVSYPDKALSELTSLRALFMDGIQKARLGSGFGLLQGLKNLSFVGFPYGFCDMVQLHNDTFKHHPPALEYLNLSYCNIRSIDADAFTPLRTLQILDLSHNEDLGFQRLGLAVYGLQGSALHTLHINHINSHYALCVAITRAETVYFKNTSIIFIYAKHNNLQFFFQGALLNMPDSLEFVSLDGNHLGFGKYLEDLNKLKSLKQIHADGYQHSPKSPTHYPDEKCVSSDAEIWDGDASSCGTVSESKSQCYWSAGSTGGTEMLADQIEGYAVTGRATDNSTFFVLPANLTDFRSRQNQIYYQLTQVNMDSNNTLTRLDLSQNLITKMVGPITGLTHLQYLDLSDNLAYYISETFCYNFTSLKVLRLSRNYLRYSIGNSSSDLFTPLVNLETLELSDNYIYNLSTNLLNGLVSLRVLNLSFNEISSFDVNISSSKRIRLLDLAYNDIHFLPSHVCTHLDSVAQVASENVTVNLTYNHIICTCENIEFLSWMAHTKVYFPRVQKYFCLMSDGTVQHLVDIFEVIADLQKECSSYVGIIVGTVCCCCCLLVAVVSALMYRFRWKLRYLYYASRMSFRRIQSQEPRQFHYDAFVSYASEDDDFVRGQLVYNLEVQENLRLNVHDRNITPGHPIPYNIVDAVENSRRTVVVLTRHLLQSERCKYEIQMATMEAVHTGRDVLVFLLYEDIPSNELPSQVLYNVQSSTYIQFPHNDPTMLPAFWSRLARAIRT